MIENQRIPIRIIRKIVRYAPTFTSSENYGRSGGYYGENDSNSKGYESICIYIQNGLGVNFELFKILVKAIFKIQKGGKRKYPLFVFGFGNSRSLQHENKYFDFGYLTDVHNDIKVAQTIARISGTDKIDQAIIPELFPKTDMRSLYYGKTKIDRNDLLIFIGNKGKMYFNSKLRTKISRIKRQILLIEIYEDSVDYTFRPLNLEYI